MIEVKRIYSKADDAFVILLKDGVPISKFYGISEFLAATVARATATATALDLKYVGPAQEVVVGSPMTISEFRKKHRIAQALGLMPEIKSVV
jgi:hypothetical protein